VVKRDFRASGTLVKGSGAQVVFSSVLPSCREPYGKKQADATSQYLSPRLASVAELGVFQSRDVLCDTRPAGP